MNELISTESINVYEKSLHYFIHLLLLSFFPRSKIFEFYKNYLSPFISLLLSKIQYIEVEQNRQFVTLS